MFIPSVLSKGKLTVGKVYAGLLILENWKSTRFGKLPGANALVSIIFISFNRFFIENNITGICKMFYTYYNSVPNLISFKTSISYTRINFEDKYFEDKYS